jgi:ketosteroid isomerase-like protein
MEQPETSAADDRAKVRVVRALYRAFAARDLARARELLSPDVQWRQSPGFPGGQVRQGADAVLSGIIGAFQREWEGWRFHPERFLEAGDTVVVLGAYRATNRATGRSMVSETAHVFEIIDGRIAAFNQYSDTSVIRDAMA